MGNPKDYRLESAKKRILQLESQLLNEMILHPLQEDLKSAPPRNGTKLNLNVM